MRACHVGHVTLYHHITPSDVAVAVLYNDETHSFDDVIGQLRRAVAQCSTDTARMHANAGGGVVM